MANEIVAKVSKLSKSTKETKVIRMFQVELRILNNLEDLQQNVASLFRCRYKLDLFWKGRQKLINFGSL